MDDTRTGTDAMGAATPASATPAPKHQSPVDQAKDVAKKVLATITGRAKS